MGYSEEAIRKGIISEQKAKVFFLQEGFTILEPVGHEDYFDFVIYGKESGLFCRVQVKTVGIYRANGGDYYRVRNKRGSANTFYKPDDYDVLAAVNLETEEIFLFRSEDINSGEFGESITLGRVDGSEMTKRKSPKPYYVGKL